MNGTFVSRKSCWRDSDWMVISRKTNPGIDIFWATPTCCSVNFFGRHSYTTTFCLVVSAYSWMDWKICLPFAAESVAVSMAYISHCFLLNMYFHWFNWIHIFRAHLHLNWSNLLFCPWNGNPFKIQLSSFIDSRCSLLEISSIPKCSLLSESSNSSKKTWFSLLTKANRQARLSCWLRTQWVWASKWCGKLGIWKAFSRYARSQFADGASIPLGFHEKWSPIFFRDKPSNFFWGAIFVRFLPPASPRTVGIRGLWTARWELLIYVVVTVLLNVANY